MRLMIPIGLFLLAFLLMDVAGIEARPVRKPMHKQPVYKNVPAYINGVSETIFKVGMCLPAGAFVSNDDVWFVVKVIKDVKVGL